MVVIHIVVIQGVPEEDTESRLRSQLVGSGGCGVRVTRTPEDSKVIIPRRGNKKSMIWRGSWAGSRGKTVKEIGGDVQTLSPEASREGSLKQKGVHGVIGGANHALSLAVLRGGIRTRHAQLDTIRDKEGTGGGVIELTTIVTLDGLDGEAKLCGHPSEEVEERGEGIRLRT